jgi:protoporphyrin/coproporphyrin ferrochelatase
VIDVNFKPVRGNDKICLLSRPFDAVLLISFGGPGGLADIRPFLANVLRGRPVHPSRIEEVAHHYELFGGVSPLTAYTMKQAEGLRARLAAAGVPLPVYVGMRNWNPFLRDTLREMSQAGVRRALGFITAAHGSYSSCQQYKENVRDARRGLIASEASDVEVTYAQGWHAHQLFIDANAQHIREALARLPSAARARARLIFTAHSIPERMAAASRYREQLHETASRIAERLGRRDWAVVYQSRSGRPQDPWLEPDICDYLRSSRDQGLEAAVVSPIGFVCDHIEVLYDLNTEAAAVAREVGIEFALAEAVNDDPVFLDMMADVVLASVHKYASGRPLPITIAGS